MFLRPLSGIRIVEAGTTPTLAYCGRLLGSLGAEVIRIESPEAVGGPASDLDWALGTYLHSDKRRVKIDLLTPAGKGLVARLASESAVLIHDAKAGIDVEETRRQIPQLHILSISPFADTRREAESDMVVQHASGLAWHQATPVSDPERRPPVAGADLEGPLSAGVAAAAAVVSMIATDLKPGQRGKHFHFSVCDFYSHLLVEPVADWSAGARGLPRKGIEGRGPEIAGGLIWLLETRDGWIVVSPREQHQWDRWIELIGSPAWSTDMDLCGDGPARSRNALRLQALMSEWSRLQPKADVFSAAQGARVPCFPINSPDDLLANEQLAARRFFDRATLADGRAIRVPGLPFDMISADFRTLERDRALKLRPIENTAELINADSSERRQKAVAS